MSVALSGCCHVAWSKWWVWRESLENFSQRWQGIRQGIRSRALTYSCMPWANGKGEFFQGRKQFHAVNEYDLLAQSLSWKWYNLCLCSKKVMKENCLPWYRVNLRVSQTMLNHNQNLFLVVCYCSVCLHWRVCKSFWVAHLHIACTFKPESVFSILSKFWQISFVVFCAQMLQQLPLTPKGC